MDVEEASDRKTLGQARRPVSVPLWVLTDLCMAAEHGNLAEPAKDALKAAHKAIRNLEAKEYTCDVNPHGPTIPCPRCEPCTTKEVPK